MARVCGPGNRKRAARLRFFAACVPWPQAAGDHKRASRILPVVSRAIPSALQRRSIVFSLRARGLDNSINPTPKKTWKQPITRIARMKTDTAANQIGVIRVIRGSRASCLRPKCLSILAEAKSGCNLGEMDRSRTLARQGRRTSHSRRPATCLKCASYVTRTDPVSTA